MSVLKNEPNFDLGIAVLSKNNFRFSTQTFKKFMIIVLEYEFLFNRVIFSSQNFKLKKFIFEVWVKTAAVLCLFKVISI